MISLLLCFNSFLFDFMQHFFDIFDPPDDFSIFFTGNIIKGGHLSLSFLTPDQNGLILCVEGYSTSIEEVDLKNFVVESEHDGMLGFEPLPEIYFLVFFITFIFLSRG